MSISTRSELEAAIALWLDRSDLTAEIPGFIDLLEGQLNRQLRSERMVCRTRATTAKGFTALPDRWLEAISIRLPEVADKRKLVYKPPHELIDLYYGELADTPRFYTILGREIQVAPEPNAATVVEMVYYKKIVLGTADSDTNWLLEEAPDVYLFGALTMANAYLKHDERVQTWADRLSNAMTELNNMAMRNQYSGGPLNRSSSSMGNAT